MYLKEDDHVFHFANVLQGFGNLQYMHKSFHSLGGGQTNTNFKNFEKGM